MLYTFLFIAFALLVYLPFIIEGKNFIFKDEQGGGDGLVQHYNAFVYYGKYLREIIRTLIAEHRFVIPMFDLSIGYGQDIIQTLSYYVIGDPFSFLSVFIPSKFAEYGYTGLIILRQFAAGIAFLLFYNYIKSRQQNESRAGGRVEIQTNDSGSQGLQTNSLIGSQGLQTNSLFAVIGALVYSFSSYPVVMGLIHPYFLNPMVYLPLIFLGAEKIFRNERPLLFVGAVAISALSNFYFFYMIVIMTVIYVVVRYIVAGGFGELSWFGGHRESADSKGGNRHSGVAGFIKTFFIFLSYGILGGMIAAVLLVPSLIGILTSSRIMGETYVPFFYEPRYYTDLLGFFLTGAGFKNYPIMGYTSLALLSLIVFLRMAFAKSGASKSIQTKTLLVFLALGLLFMLFPFFGHFFNGLSYVTNRWVWALNLLIAFIVAEYLPLVGAMSTRAKAISLGITVFMAVVPLINKDFRVVSLIVGVIVAVITSAIVLVVSSSKWTKPHLAIVVLLLAVSVAQNSFMRFMPVGDNMQACYVESGLGYLRLVYDAPAGVLKQIKNPEDAKAFYRYDTPHFNNYNAGRNSSMLYEKYSTSYYFSASNPSVTDFFKELYINFPTEQSYVNLDSRSPLMWIMGVKYAIVFTAYPEYVPYSYDHEEYFGVTYGLYQTDKYLPMGFTSPNYIERSDLDNLDPVRKQAALLQGIVIGDSEAKDSTYSNVSDSNISSSNSGSGASAGSGAGIDLSGLNKVSSFDFDDRELSWSITETDGATYEGFDKLADGATYEGFDKPADGATAEFADGTSAGSQDESSDESVAETYNGLTGKFIVSKEKATTTITFDPVSDGELYFIYEGADYTPDSEYTDSHYEGVIRMIGDDGKTSWVTLRNKMDNYYNGRHNFLSNMHYTTGERSSVTLEFRDKGEYTVDNLRVVFQPTEKFAENVAGLQEYTLDNLKILTGLKGGADKNTISGDINVPDSRLLCFSVPYSAGWKAYVDGEETEIAKADIAFMAIKLEPGSHYVELRYQTPYLGISAIISAVGLVLFVLLAIFGGRDRNKTCH